MFLSYKSFSDAISYAKTSNNFRYQRFKIAKKLAEKFPTESSSFVSLMCEDLKFICENQYADWNCADYNQFCKCIQNQRNLCFLRMDSNLKPYSSLL